MNWKEVSDMEFNEILEQLKGKKKGWYYWCAKLGEEFADKLRKIRNVR